MAKKQSGKRRASAPPSKKSSRGARKPAPRSSKTQQRSRSTSKKSVPKRSAPKKAVKKGVSYKNKYVELLEKTNKKLFKEIKSIRKVIDQPPPLEEEKEPFPKEEPLGYSAPRKKGKITNEDIAAELREINSQIHQRNIMLEEMIESSGKNDM